MKNSSFKLQAFTRSGATWALAFAALSAVALPSTAQAAKRTSGVVVQTEVPKNLRVGESTTLRLRISGVTAADGATVDVRNPANGQTVFSARLAKGEERTVELPYTATRDGVQFFDIHTRQGQLSSVKSVGVPAGSGTVAMKREGKPMLMPNGEAVVSLPANR